MDNLSCAMADGGMGFRDFANFNLDLLAKQWWRIFQDDSLLSFQVFQAKYFVGVNAHRANLGSRPSYLWRSLMAGKVVVDSGCLWRDLINQFFSEVGKRCIEQIHLSKERCDDRIIWLEKSSGRLDVRSAYFMDRRSANILMANRYARDNVWVLVWSVTVPPKVKVFWWKLLHSFLLVVSILRNRDIPLVDRCPVCGMSGETIYHVLVLCPFAASVWGQFTGTPQLNVDSDLSWVEQWSVVLNVWKSNDTLHMHLVVGWFTWFHRNQCLHVQLCLSSSKLVSMIKSMVAEYSVTNANSGVEDIPVFHIWQRPPEGVLKLNVDAGFSIRDQIATCGMVVRNFARVCLISAITKLPGVSSPLLAEMKAILFGLQLVHAERVLRLVVETDSLMAIKENTNN
ncbi:hypothetical protein PTKIN_Ptkin13bG0230800 [Pterospermum kingtungense]